MFTAWRKTQSEIAAVNAWRKYIDSSGITNGYHASLRKPYVLDKQTDFGVVRLLIANTNAKEWYEPEYGDFFGKLVRLGGIREGDTIFDLGAHHGLFSLVFEKVVGRTGRVFAFEPFAFHTEVFRLNLALNKSRRVHLFAVGIGTVSQTLSVAEGGDSISSTALGRTPGRLSQIQIEPFFSFANLKPNYIKVDIEGAEITLARQFEECYSDARSSFVEYHQPLFKNFIPLEEEEAAARDLLDTLHRIFGFVYVEDKSETGMWRYEPRSRLPTGFAAIFCRRSHL
jgi:FkbM family methyltransferase